MDEVVTPYNLPPWLFPPRGPSKKPAGYIDPALLRRLLAEDGAGGEPPAPIEAPPESLDLGEGGPGDGDPQLKQLWRLIQAKQQELEQAQQSLKAMPKESILGSPAHVAARKQIERIEDELNTLNRAYASALKPGAGGKSEEERQVDVEYKQAQTAHTRVQTTKLQKELEQGVGSGALSKAEAMMRLRQGYEAIKKSQRTDYLNALKISLPAGTQYVPGTEPGGFIQNMVGQSNRNIPFMPMGVPQPIPVKTQQVEMPTGNEPGLPPDFLQSLLQALAMAQYLESNPFAQTQGEIPQ